MITKYIANTITGLRVFCSLILLFLPIPSVSFWCAYLFCGFTDIIDGMVARRTNTTSKLGAKLDTIGDLLFLTTSFIKLFSILRFPKWLWIWIAAIAILKLCNLVYCFYVRSELLSQHTMMNKLTGFLLFLFPFTVNFIDIRFSSAVICVAATLAATQESYYTMTGRHII